jgi:uncharacterized protein (TIRG00374 family)
LRARSLIAAALLILVAWLLWRFIAAASWKDAWQLISSLKWWQILAIILLPFFGHFTNALRWWIILAALGAHRYVRLGELFAYSVTGFATSYLIPSADLSGKALRILLIRRKGVLPADALLSLSLEVFFGSIVDSALRLSLIFGFGYWWLFGGLGRSFFWIAPVLGILFVFFLLPLLPKSIADRLIPKKLKRFPTLDTFLQELENSRQKLSSLLFSKPTLLIVIVALSLLLPTIVAIEIWLITRFLGSDAPILFGFLYSTMLHFAGIIPIMAGAGVLENLMYETFVILGQPSSLGTATILLLRFKDFCWVIAGLLILLKNGKNIGRTKSNKSE